MTFCVQVNKGYSKRCVFGFNFKLNIKELLFFLLPMNK